MKGMLLGESDYVIRTDYQDKPEISCSVQHKYFKSWSVDDSHYPNDTGDWTIYCTKAKYPDHNIKSFWNGT